MSPVSITASNPTEALAQVNSLATNSVMTIWNYAGDFTLMFVIISVLFYYGWYIGRGQLVGILLAFYAGYAAYLVFPFMELLPSAPAVTAVSAHLGFYLFLSFTFYVIMRRVIVSDFLSVGIIGLLILSFLGAGFLFALAFNAFSITEVYRFTPPVELLFSPQEYFYWWFMAPAIGLFLFAR